MKEIIKTKHSDPVLLDFIDFAYEDHDKKDYENYIQYFQNNVGVLENLMETLDNIINQQT